MVVIYFNIIICCFMVSGIVYYFTNIMDFVVVVIFNSIVCCVIVSVIGDYGDYNVDGATLLTTWTMWS